MPTVENRRSNSKRNWLITGTRFRGGFWPYLSADKKIKSFIVIVKKNASSKIYMSQPDDVVEVDFREVPPAAIVAFGLKEADVRANIDTVTNRCIYQL